MEDLGSLFDQQKAAFQSQLNSLILMNDINQRLHRVYVEYRKELAEKLKIREEGITSKDAFKQMARVGLVLVRRKRVSRFPDIHNAEYLEPRLVSYFSYQRSRPLPTRDGVYRLSQILKAKSNNISQAEWPFYEMLVTETNLHRDIIRRILANMRQMENIAQKGSHI